MMKLLLVLGIVLASNVALVATGAHTYVASYLTPTTTNAPIESEVVDVFMFTLRDEVVKSGLMTGEGLTPDAYLRVLPGLVANDFDGVRSQVGVYTYADGKLVHVQDGGRLITDASFIVTRAGMEQLLNNVLERTGLSLEEDTITDVINVVVNESATRR